MNDKDNHPTVICRCEEVTQDEIQAVIRRGYHSLEEIKRILRCGMGHCQGRGCLTIIAGMLSRETGVPVSSMEFPTSRPPLKPVPLGVLGLDDDAEETADARRRTPTGTNGRCGSAVATKEIEDEAFG